MIRPHPFSPDTSATDRPDGIVGCVLCPFPKGNRRIHVERHEHDESARIVGDKEGGSDG